MAASTSGRFVVAIGTNGGYSFSGDAGRTWTEAGLACPAGFTACNGDPSLAVGLSGAFYYAIIGYPTGTSTQDPAGTASTVIYRSTNNGQTFKFVNNAVVCNNGVAPTCFPDQEHITADRTLPGTGGGDQVYSVWRNFDASDQDPALVCSQDGGQNWTAPLNVGTGFVPRIGIGGDGFVYVIYRTGNNITLHKFSPCSAGLTPQAGFPLTVTGVSDVTCPVAGLDRCNDGNILSSHTVAVDDVNPQRVYVSYSTNTTAGVNENVFVRVSTDGGATWPAGAVAQVNTAGGRAALHALGVLGRRRGLRDVVRPAVRHPRLHQRLHRLLWRVSAPRRGRHPRRRARVPYLRRVRLQLRQRVALRTARQRRLRDLPRATATRRRVQRRGRGYARLQPALRLHHGPGLPARRGMPDRRRLPEIRRLQRQRLRGRPAVHGLGRRSGAAGVPAGGGIDTFTDNRVVVCCVPQIQTSGALDFGSACGGTPVTRPLEVCNQGKELLTVTGITSSNPQYTVAAPVPGYPFDITAGNCQTMQVTFSPTGPGTVNATLSIASNDPVYPTLTVNLSGTSGSADVNLTGSGQFGAACADRGRAQHQRLQHRHVSAAGVDRHGGLPALHDRQQPVPRSRGRQRVCARDREGTRPGAGHSHLQLGGVGHRATIPTSPRSAFPSPDRRRRRC